MALTLKRAATTGVLAAVLATAGCTSSDKGTHPTLSTSAKSTAAKSGAALPPGVVGLTKVPTAVPNKPTLRNNVSLSSCASAHGGWAASGTARNPSKSSASYRITVFFTTDHATVIGQAATTVQVAAGASSPWIVTGAFHPASPTLCVLRGVG
jgi:hypothetical protein